MQDWKKTNRLPPPIDPLKEERKLKSPKIFILEVLKWLCVAGLLVLLFVLLSSTRVSRADFSDVQSAVLAATDLSPMAEGDNQTLKRL